MAEMYKVFDKFLFIVFIYSYSYIKIEVACKIVVHACNQVYTNETAYLHAEKGTTIFNPPDIFAKSSKFNHLRKS